VPQHSVSIRSATDRDAAVIAELLSELGYEAPPADIPARLAGVIAEGGAVVLATDASGSALGLMHLGRHAALHTPGPIAYIMALVTRSTARHAGVGRQLVEYAKEWARETGCVRLSVTSAEKRQDAHAFYVACGMPYTGRRFATTIAD
jgi:GNAT superfamily N-acetyltransferase